MKVVVVEIAKFHLTFLFELCAPKFDRWMLNIAGIIFKKISLFFHTSTSFNQFNKIKLVYKSAQTLEDIRIEVDGYLAQIEGK